MLKLLADENIAADMVMWLRQHGCDVVHAAEGLGQECFNPTPADGSSSSPKRKSASGVWIVTRRRKQKALRLDRNKRKLVPKLLEDFP